MYKIEVESPLFRGKGLVAQHRMVKAALATEIADMHGLTLLRGHRHPRGETKPVFVILWGGAIEIWHSVLQGSAGFSGPNGMV